MPSSPDISSFFVRAVYDYIATEASSIDLAEGDLIEVFSQLENGWWDGRLVTKRGCPRGWFPSTFVIPVSDDEAEEEIISVFFSHRPIGGWFGLSPSDRDKPMGDKETADIASVVDDFWLPQVTADGRVMYRNSHTGEETWSVPSVSIRVPEPSDRPLSPASILDDSSFVSSDPSESDDAAVLFRPKGDRIKPNFGSRAFRDPRCLSVSPRSVSQPRQFYDVPITFHQLNHHANSIRQSLRELSRITSKAMDDAEGRPMPYPRDNANKLIQKVLRLLYIAGGLARQRVSNPGDSPMVESPPLAFHTRHHKTVVALFRLILSLRDARHSSMSITIGRQVIHDASEIARAAFTLVRELTKSSRATRQRVLRVVTPSPISPDEATSHSLPLDVVTLAKFKSLRSNVNEMFAISRDMSKQDVAASGRTTELISIAVTQLSALLACTEALEMPQFSPSELTTWRTLRMDTVAHDMETTKTSLFNEGILLLATTRETSVPNSPIEQTASSVDTIISSILRRVRQLESCLTELITLDHCVATDSSVPLHRPIPPPRAAANRSSKVQELVSLERSASSSSLPKTEEASTSSPEQLKPEAFEVGPAPQSSSDSISHSSGILTGPDGSVRGGTLEALVMHLTLHDKQDFAFHDTFFLTFRSFTTVSEIFPLLVARFNVAPPEDLEAAQLEHWVHTIQHLIRIRVIKALVSLLQSDDMAGPEDLATLDKIKTFANEISASYPDAKRLVGLADIAKHSSEPSGSFTRGNLTYEPISPPSPSVPKLRSDRRLSLLDLEPLEVARQLTLKESELFKKILPREFFARAKEGPRKNDSFTTSIALVNQTAYWVCDEILHRREPKGRASVIGHFIYIAHHCRELNNFSSMTAIVAGLNSTPIRRLKRSWTEVKPKAITYFQELETMVQSWKSLVEFRHTMVNVTGPCVPFLGVYLTASLFIQDGMKDTLDKEGKIINFAKRAKAAEIVTEIQAYQAAYYDLSSVAPIRLFIDKSLLVTASPDEFWELSLKREPRDGVPDVPSERRWLLMSGFVAF